MFRAQQYTGVAALCADALDGEPDNLELRVIRVRALLALRRDEEAQRELSRILRWSSQTGEVTAEVFRLLGELAIRREKLRAAETFLRQALRLSADDRKTKALLELVQSSNQPTVAVEKLPAATATVGCTLSDEAPGADGEAGVGDGDEEDAARSRPPRLALGTDYTPATPSPLPVSHRSDRPEHPEHPDPSMQPDPGPPDLFGRYLVVIGALTPVQLHAVLDYHRRAGIPVGAAAVILGFVTAPRVEGAAQSYHQARNDW
jgi:Tetratricopeptide repeat